MRLLCIFAAILAFSLGEESATTKPLEDLEAVATVELLKENHDVLQPAASSYTTPREKKWTNLKSNNPNYYPQNNYVSQSNYVPPQNNYVPPQNSYIPPQNNYVPPQNNYIPPQNDYVPPQNNYVPPQNTYVPPQNTYVPPQNTYVPPQNNYVPPQNTYVPPQNNYVPPQNNYVPPNNNWYNPQQQTSSTTTPSSLIKNDITYGDNGSYKYEYEIADGTYASEEGYSINPNTENESIVKIGKYSYPGPDGKVYTVTYWADHTGFHATGDHIPTPPPIPPAIQASIEQNAKEEAARAEAEKNKPQQTYYPSQTVKPQQTYYPPQQTYYPPQQTYYPPQQTYYPQQQNPSYGK
ncbi:adhesive plaque matrix protein-like [Galleria mellonella]|uniref:Adhesive plaque matrix protein-like n=1 Tax=Galleria mellonella TaxID=7137 RepID=A0A6J1WAW0_GALME|nr:adhesive plaque matrix protein-like [Galleria mellonella]